MDSVEKQDNSILKLALQKILSRTIKISGCQSASIRLQKNEDFPFYVHEGIPDFFVLKESNLLARDETGRIVYDQNNSPID